MIVRPQHLLGTQAKCLETTGATSSKPTSPTLDPTLDASLLPSVSTSRSVNCIRANFTCPPTFHDLKTCIKHLDARSDHASTQEALHSLIDIASHFEEAKNGIVAAGALLPLVRLAVCDNPRLREAALQVGCKVAEGADGRRLALIAAGAVEAAVHTLCCAGVPARCHEAAALLLMNIASGTDVMREAIIASEAAAVLVALLSCDDSSCQAAAAWALAKLAEGPSEVQSHVSACGAHLALDSLLASSDSQCRAAASQLAIHLSKGRLHTAILEDGNDPSATGHHSPAIKPAKESLAAVPQHNSQEARHFTPPAHKDKPSSHKSHPHTHTHPLLSRQNAARIGTPGSFHHSTLAASHKSTLSAPDNNSLASSTASMDDMFPGSDPSGSSNAMAGILPGNISSSVADVSSGRTDDGSLCIDTGGAVCIGAGNKETGKGCIASMNAGFGKMYSSVTSSGGGVGKVVDHEDDTCEGIRINAHNTSDIAADSSSSNAGRNLKPTHLSLVTHLAGAHKSDCTCELCTSVPSPSSSLLTSSNSVLTPSEAPLSSSRHDYGGSLQDNNAAAMNFCLNPLFVSVLAAATPRTDAGSMTPFHVMEDGGLKAAVGLLVDTLGQNPQVGAVRALAVLAETGDGMRRALVAAGVLTPLIAMLEAGGDTGAIFGGTNISRAGFSAVSNTGATNHADRNGGCRAAAVGLLQVLAVGGERICRAIAESGALPPLIALLDCTDPPTRLATAQALEALIQGSTVCADSAILHGAVPRLVEVLATGDLAMVDVAAAALATLAGQGPAAAATVAAADTARVLVRVMTWPAEQGPRPGPASKSWAGSNPTSLWSAGNGPMTAHLRQSEGEWRLGTGLTPDSRTHSWSSATSMSQSTSTFSQLKQSQGLPYRPPRPRHPSFHSPHLNYAPQHSAERGKHYPVYSYHSYEHQLPVAATLPSTMRLLLQLSLGAAPSLRQSAEWSTSLVLQDARPVPECVVAVAVLAPLLQLMHSDVVEFQEEAVGILSVLVGARDSMQSAAVVMGIVDTLRKLLGPGPEWGVQAAGINDDVESEDGTIQPVRKKEEGFQQENKEGLGADQVVVHGLNTGSGEGFDHDVGEGGDEAAEEGAPPRPSLAASPTASRLGNTSSFTAIRTVDNTSFDAGVKGCTTYDGISSRSPQVMGAPPPALRHATAQALCVLAAASEDLLQELAESGAMECILQHLCQCGGGIYRRVATTTHGLCSGANIPEVSTVRATVTLSVQLLSSCSVASLQALAASLMSGMARSGEFMQEVLISAGAVCALVGALATGNGACRRDAAGTLAALATGRPDVAAESANAGVMELLVQMLPPAPKTTFKSHGEQSVSQEERDHTRKTSFSSPTASTPASVPALALTSTGTSQHSSTPNMLAQSLFTLTPRRTLAVSPTIVSAEPMFTPSGSLPIPMLTPTDTPRHTARPSDLYLLVQENAAAAMHALISASPALREAAVHTGAVPALARVLTGATERGRKAAARVLKRVAALPLTEEHPQSFVVEEDGRVAVTSHPSNTCVAKGPVQVVPPGKGVMSIRYKVLLEEGACAFWPSFPAVQPWARGELVEGPGLKTGVISVKVPYGATTFQLHVYNGAKNVASQFVIQALEDLGVVSLEWLELADAVLA